MFRRIVLLLFLSIFLSGCNLVSAFKSNQKSGLQITSTPQVTVFLDGNSLGITPILEENLKPGKYTIKLSPSDSSIQPWETQVTLTPGVLTVIDRKLSSAFDQSHGYTLSFEKLSDKSSNLAITTSPDSVTITIDGKPQGFTPVSLDSLTEGDHTILLTSPGFEDKTIRARTVEGYSLTVAAQLAKKAAPVLGLDTEATSSATPSANLTPSIITKATPTPKLSITPTKTASNPAAISKPYVEIDNPNVNEGFANVRSTPGGGSILGSPVNGERFPYLDQQQNGYYKIEYQTGKPGWVAIQYSSLVQ